jgi:hypothetical protein
VDIFCYVGEARAAAILVGALETTLAPMRNPYNASRGRGLAVRTANLAQARESLGDACYEEARAGGAAMTRADALAFVLGGTRSPGRLRPRRRVLHRGADSRVACFWRTSAPSAGRE